MDEKIYPQEVELKCKSKVAYESVDHIYPKGAGGDNSKNWLFNYKYYNLYRKKYLKILDLGCAGGGFVRECINDGCFAMGLEGSDYSKRMKRAEWATIPDSLHTCDITKKFEIINKGEILKFNLITAWEVLEHIEPGDIDSLIENIKNHLSHDGLFIASVANYSDKIGDIEYHRTQKPKKWWIRKFEHHGFCIAENLYPYFNRQYIRGRHETSRQFHLILRLKSGTPHRIIKKSTKQRILDEIRDLWSGSRIQRFLLS